MPFSEVLGLVVISAFLGVVFYPIWILHRVKMDKSPQKKGHLNKFQICIAWICIFVIAGEFFLFFRVYG